MCTPIHSPYPQVRFPTKIGLLTKAQRDYYSQPLDVGPVLISTPVEPAHLPTTPPSTWKQNLIQKVVIRVVVTIIKEVLRYFLG